MAISTTMRALEIRSLTGPTAAQLGDHPVPRPGPGEVLIKVGAAGINFADIMQTRGIYPPGPAAPYLGGIEVCGEVVALGDGDEIYPPGAKVIGAGLKGCWAEYVIAPAASLMPLPDGWTETQGAAFFANWVTAYICLVTLGRISQDQTVLIHAAAGGVGQTAVHLAKHFGARVFATASTEEKLDVARNLGADELINYTKQDFVAEVKSRTGERGVDLILEMVGGDTFRKNLEAVVPYGNIVVFGYASSAKKVDINNVGMIWDYPVSITGMTLGSLIGNRPDLFGQVMGEIGELIASGVIRPEEPMVHSLADGSQVLSDLEQRKTTGKQVFVP